MIFVVSGEGPGDIGACNSAAAECAGPGFRAGPMSVIIDQQVELITGYSVLDARAVEFISEGSLSARARKLPLALSVGKKRGFETAYFFKGARALARHALQRQRKEGCPVGAIFFRDADGTRSTERGLFQLKWNSMRDGFIAEAFDFGVPMVPKPKSEAWLLCAVKAQPYQHCGPLEEELSGNDHSPNPAKLQLETILRGMDREVTDLAQMVADGTISSSRINMPSFTCFRDRLENVAQRMFGLAT